MDDVIYRRAAIRWVKIECNPYGNPTLDYDSGIKVIEHLKQMPAAEPEIVRCKDCKYYNTIGVCIEMSSAVCEDSFCCWAERRTDERSD